MAKRLKTGSIYSRPNSPYLWIKFYVPGESAPVRESTGTAEWEEAEKYLHRRLGEVATGKWAGLEPERIKCSELFNFVREDYTNNKRASIRMLDIRLRCHLEPFFGPLKAATIGQRQITAYVAARVREGAKNATINRDLEILRRAFRLGFESDLVAKPLKVKKLAEDNVRDGMVTHEQYLKLRAGLPEPYRTLFVCGYHMGTRLGELSLLQWSEVDFAASEIVLKRYNTKTKKPRILPIYGDMREFLLFANSRQVKDCPWVFSSKGKKFRFRHDRWNDLLEKLGCSGIHFHDLRRTAATNMIRNGFSEKEAMAITGHKTRIMFDRYHIVRREEIHEVGRRMEGFYQALNDVGTQPGTHTTESKPN